MPKIEQEPVQNDIDLFLKVFKFPVRPQKVQWQVTILGNPKDANDLLPGPTDYSRLAVIEFAEKDLEFLAQLKQKKEIYPVAEFTVGHLTADWFAPETKAQMKAVFEGKDEIEVTTYDLENSSIAFSGKIIKIPQVDAFLLISATH